VRFSIWSSNPVSCRMFTTPAPLSSLITASVATGVVLGSSQSARAYGFSPLSIWPRDAAAGISHLAAQTAASTGGGS
jgi:hypothetical protein